MSESNKTEISEEQFWLSIMKVFAVALCFLIASITGSCQYGKYTMISMVEDGASPIESACALDALSDGSISRAECIAYLLTQTK